MILVGDTSGLLAAFDLGEPGHARARRVLNDAGLTLVSPLVALELEVVAGRRVGRDAAHVIVDWLLAMAARDRVRIVEHSADDLRSARRIQRRYADLDLDLTDAVNVVVAHRYDTADILTLDRRDFRVVAPLTRHAAFRVLPDDA